MPEPVTDDPAELALRALAQRLQHAADVTERMIGEAAAAVAGRGGGSGGGADRAARSRTERPAAPDPPEGPRAVPRTPELQLLFELGERLGELVPEELQQRLTDALRELLLAIQALVDWYAERLEHRRRAPVTVTDIPIS